VKRPYICVKHIGQTWWCPWRGYVLSSPDEVPDRDTPKTPRRYWSKEAAYKAALREWRRVQAETVYKMDEEEQW
jgi:hypothetical protein